MATKSVAEALAENSLRGLGDQLQDVTGRGMSGFSTVVVAHGLRFTLIAVPVVDTVFEGPVANAPSAPTLFPTGVALAPAPDAPVDVLPAGFHDLTEKQQQVFRVIRAVRDTPAGRQQKLRPKQIVTEYEKMFGLAIGVSTVGHACTVLLEAGFVERTRIGYVVAAAFRQKPNSNKEGSAASSEADGSLHSA